VISRKTIILITIAFRISNLTVPMAYPGIGGGEGVQQIQLRKEGRENRDMGAFVP
jgi:hypothetical protein